MARNNREREGRAAKGWVNDTGGRENRAGGSAFVFGVDVWRTTSYILTNAGFVPVSFFRGAVSCLD